QNSGMVRNQRDQEDVQRSRNQLQHLVGHGKRGVAIRLGGVEDQRRQAIQQRRRRDHDERDGLDQSPEFQPRASKELRPLRALSKLPRDGRNLHGGRQSCFFHFALLFHLRGSFRKAEAPVSEGEHQQAHAHPDQTVPQQQPAVSERQRVFVRHRPVLGG